MVVWGRDGSVTTGLDAGRQSSVEGRGCCAATRRMCTSCEAYFDRLWQLRGSLVGRLGRWGIDRGTADDLAAEALVVAWQRLDRVPTEPGQAERWLMAVARNLLRNHRRKALRASQLLRLYQAGLRVDSNAYGSDGVLFREAWSLLAPPDREVLWLAVSKGLGPEDLAAQLNCSPGAAKKRLSRARRRLDALMAP